MILRGRMLSSTDAPGPSWLTVHLPYCAPRRKQLSSRSLQVPRTSRRQHLVSRRRAELADRRLAVRLRSFAESHPESAIRRHAGHEIASRSVTGAGRRTVCKYPAWAEVPRSLWPSAPHRKGCPVHRGTGWATEHRLCLKPPRSATLGLGVTGASSANVQHLFVDFDRAAFGRAAVPPSLSRARCHHRMTGLVRLGDCGKSNRTSDQFGVSEVRPRPAPLAVVPGLAWRVSGGQADRVVHGQAHRDYLPRSRVALVTA
jgi:hypothetical protein